MGGAESNVAEAVSSAANTVASSTVDVVNTVTNEVSNFGETIGKECERGINTAADEIGKIFSPGESTSDPDAQLREELEKQRIEQAKLQEAINKLAAELDEKDEIDYDEHRKRTIEELYTLAKKVPSLSLPGRNIGFLGITSTGKSTMINTLLNSKVAEVGFGETTKDVASYDGQGYRLYDFPSKNDDVTSFSKYYLSLIKGLSHRIILVSATVKEITILLHLLDVLELHYDIVVNKFDLVDHEERETFRKQILEEVEKCQLKFVDHVWFVSAQNPGQFPDWIQMVNHLTS